jgi:hypothetical protein
MRIRPTRATLRGGLRTPLLRRARAPLALVAVGVLGLAGGLQAANPSGSKCPPRNPHCQTTTSTSTSTTTTTTPAPTTSLPAQWRFAYSDQMNQDLMLQYGYNLIDVTSKAEADGAPAGTLGQVWLFDYSNRSCSWEKSDSYVRDVVSSMAVDPKVAGFYFSNEPDPFACPTAPQQHKERNALIKSLAPNKYTVIGIDGNWRDHFDRYGTMWSGAADIVNYNPYVCFEGQSTCDWAWYDHVITTAQSNFASTGQKYSIAVQAFREKGEWRWPTAAEEAQMLSRLKDRSLTGMTEYMTFSWNWQNDPLLDHPTVLAEIQAYNLGLPSPCCSGSTPPATTTSNVDEAEASATPDRAHARDTNGGRVFTQRPS